MSYATYGTTDLSLYTFGFTDPNLIESMAMISDPSLFSSFPRKTNTTKTNNTSPPKHRHDGTSPLPLGIDWSPPPRIWEGRSSVWPHDPRTGWSYCVTIPSWIILPGSRGSDYVVFYRVQVGIQSPEGITTTRGVLRRFSDFLKLFSDLKNKFPKKTLPTAPPKRLLRKKNSSLLDERRCALEDWMEKLLSDIDLSRSVIVALFLELEAAVRSSFVDSNRIALDENFPANSVVPSYHLPINSDDSLVAGSSFVSESGSSYACETSELGPASCGSENAFKIGAENSICNQDLSCEVETTNSVLAGKGDDQLMEDFIQDFQLKFIRDKRLLRKDDSALENEDVHGSTCLVASNCEDRKEFSSEPKSCQVGAAASNCIDLDAPDLKIPSDFLIALPSDEQQKVNRAFITMQQRLAAANMDMEDLITRLSQELAIKQYLTTKVKDLEVELETSKQRGKENLQQAILNEKDRYTKMQWDAQDFKRKCMELEQKLKSEQDEKTLMESTIASITQQNKLLMQELDVTREKLENVLKHQEELELKTKSDVKLLIKEVKALRSSQQELKHENIRLRDAKLEGERILFREKQRSEHATATNVKLLHECEILRARLEECNINFLVGEENKLTIETSSTSDAVEQLNTCDNRVDLLIAEAQLLSQDVEKNLPDASHSNTGVEGRTTESELWKMLTSMFIANARLRKEVNSVIRCTLSSIDKADKLLQE